MKKILFLTIALILVITSAFTVFAEPSGTAQAQMTVTQEPNSDAVVTTKAEEADYDYTAFIVLLCVVVLTASIIVASVSVAAVRNKNDIVRKALDAANRIKDEKGL